MNAIAFLLAVQSPIWGAGSTARVRSPDFAFAHWSGSDRQPPTGAISDDGKVIAYSWMGRIQVDDGKTQRLIDPQDDASPPLDRDEKGEWSRRAPALALSGDGRFLARGTVFGAVVEGAMDGKRVAALTDSSASAEGPARGLAFAPDGRTLAVVRGAAGRFKLALLDVASDRTTRVAVPPATRPYVPRFTRDGRFLIAALGVPTVLTRAGGFVARASGEGPSFVSPTGTFWTLVEGRWRGKPLPGSKPRTRPAPFAFALGERPLEGFADASGVWFAVPARSLPGRPSGWESSVHLLRPGGVLKLHLPSPPDGPMLVSPNGRWLLVPNYPHFLAIDTAR